MGDTIDMKPFMTKQGCRVTTTLRKMPNGIVEQEIILQAEDLVSSPVELALEEEDTGSWLIAGS